MTVPHELVAAAGAGAAAARLQAMLSPQATLIQPHGQPGAGAAGDPRVFRP